MTVRARGGWGRVAKAGNEGNGRGVIGKFDGGWLAGGERGVKRNGAEEAEGRKGERGKERRSRGIGGNGAERRAINDALEHVTSCNTSAAMRRHIYYLDDTSIRPLIIILITLARKLPRMCASSHDSVINKCDFGGHLILLNCSHTFKSTERDYTRRA